MPEQLKSYLTQGEVWWKKNQKGKTQQSSLIGVKNLLLSWANFAKIYDQVNMSLVNLSRNFVTVSSKDSWHTNLLSFTVHLSLDITSGFIHNSLHCLEFLIPFSALGTSLVFSQGLIQMSIVLWEKNLVYWKEFGL